MQEPWGRGKPGNRCPLAFKQEGPGEAPSTVKTHTKPGVLPSGKATPAVSTASKRSQTWHGVIFFVVNPVSGVLTPAVVDIIKVGFKKLPLLSSWLWPELLRPSLLVDPPTPQAEKMGLRKAVSEALRAPTDGDPA